MSTTTRCPHCGTRFNATQAQLEAYHGMVRCGHCHGTFDAVANRCEEGASPQLALPIMLEQPAAQGIKIGASDLSGTHGDDPASADVGDYPELSTKIRTWPWVVGGVFVSALLVLQAAYFFRVEIAARAPGLKPALLAGCKVLDCDIPLPRNADLLSIESSDLEADPAKPGIITLSFALRNLASYAQAYPNVELTLTDTNDVTVGRRSFHPADYLKTPADETIGLAGSREIGVRLALDTTGINAAGYRLFLYY